MTPGAALVVRQPRTTWGRKAIHAAVGAIPVAWWLGLVETSTVQRLLTAAVAVAVGTELLRWRSRTFRARFEKVFGPLLKPHERDAVTGATWLALSLLLAVLLFPPEVARAALWAGAVGDASAAVVGGAWGVWRRRTGKSVAGSAACALVSAAGAYWLGGFALVPSALVGVAAAVAEWPPRPGDDNARVTLLAGAAAWILVRG